MRTRRAVVVLCCAALVACNRGDGETARVDGSQLTSSSGEVALSDGGSLEFSITSDQYKQWYAAQQKIDKRIASRFGALLQPKSPSERSIRKAVDYLESQPSARQAIESAGLTVRAFVVTTVALEQEMRVASESGRHPEPMPAPMPYTFPVDSTYLKPYPPPTPYPAQPAFDYRDTLTVRPRIDTIPRVDTVFRPPRPAPDTLTPRRDSAPPRLDFVAPVRDTLIPRRDTVIPRRDTVIPVRDMLPTRRDSVVPKRDSVAPRRDTLTPQPPRDTLPRDTLPSRQLARP
jgi:hypothetical protein